MKRSRQRICQRSSQRQPLAFEVLENRRVLAGNVYVTIQDSILLVVGDAADNQVLISQDNAGQFVVTGQDTTTVNRSTDPFVVNGIASYVTVSMEAGNDQVVVNGINVRNNFSFYGGFGNDRLEVNGLSAKHFHGEGNPGDDVFDLNLNIRKSAYLYLGAGNDVVASENLNVGRNFKIYGHAGNDTISTERANVGRKLEFHLDTGNDNVLMSGETSVGRFARFDLGEGNDFVGVLPAENGGRAEFGEFISVDANAGNNALAFDRGVDANGRLRTELGTGTNQLQLGGADFASSDAGGFGNLNSARLNSLVDQVFATLESAGIGVPDVIEPLQATTTDSTLEITENDNATSIDPGFSLTGSQQVTSATIQVGNFVSGQEQLTFTDTSSISGNFDAATGLLTLSGNASTANYQAAVRSELYLNSSETPLTDLRQFEIVITDSDETVTVNRDFAVAAVNDAAVVTAANANQTVLPEDLPTPVDNLMTVSDVDSETLVSAEVRFDSGFVAGQDTLSVIESGGITASFDSATGILGLTGQADLATWQTVLRTLTYDNSETNPTEGTRAIRVSINDGTDSSSTVFQINLQQANQPNNFDVSQTAANGTVVGQVTTTSTFQSPLFQFAPSSSTPDDLALNPDDHFSGNLSAPVVLMEYLDFQCPACAAAHPRVESLKGTFADDLLVVQRHLPIESIHPNAREAALFAEAANRQGMFDEMVNQLFTNQADWAGLADPTSTFEGYATGLGLDLNQVQSDVADSALDSRITRDLNEAIGLGITSTPTFLLQNQQLVTPGSQTAFDQVIQDAIDGLTDPITIDRGTGEIIVRDTTLLTTSNSPITMNVLVTDQGGNTETVTVTINVTQ